MSDKKYFFNAPTLCVAYQTQTFDPQYTGHYCSMYCPALGDITKTQTMECCVFDVTLELEYFANDNKIRFNIVRCKECLNIVGMDS